MSQAQEITFNAIEAAIYRSSGSFYCGATLPNLKLGDIVLYHHDPTRWERKKNILDPAYDYVTEPKKRDEIQEALDKPNLGENVEICLTDGITFNNSLNNDAGTIQFSGLSLPGSTDGTLTMNASFTCPNACSICCKGHWESIQFPEKLLDDLKPTEKKLPTLVKDPAKTFILVTDIFITSSDLATLTPKENSEGFNVEVKDLKAAGPSEVYGQLHEEINKICPDSFKCNPAPVVPFFRGLRIQPMWLVDDTLSDKVPPPAKATTREGKVIKFVPPQPDRVQLVNAPVKIEPPQDPK